MNTVNIKNNIKELVKKMYKHFSKYDMDKIVTLKYLIQIVNNPIIVNNPNIAQRIIPIEVNSNLISLVKLNSVSDSNKSNNVLDQMIDSDLDILLDGLDKNQCNFILENLKDIYDRTIIYKSKQESNSKIEISGGKKTSTKKPSSKKIVPKKPSTKKPSSKKPVTKKPSTKKPSSKKPSTKKPVKK